MSRLFFTLGILAVFTMARGNEPASVEFFETRIRPILARECYSCHNSHTKTEGDLALDFRMGLRQGGKSGPAIIPGDANASLLIEAIRHDRDNLRMPKEGAKLSAEVIGDFESWIDAGANDPRDKPPTREDLEQASSWESVFEGRKQWWSFLPVESPAPPPAAQPGGSTHPIDRFLLPDLATAGLQPAGPEKPNTLLRRLHFNLTGLPPTPEAVAAFTDAANDPDRYEKTVDALLASPQFGERWARHWMDWFRYAESHGSEGDPGIRNAWRYRDYLIRALNNDIPYDQLVREQVAGDLLDPPRLSEDGSFNESALGTAHYRMVFHGYAPTDALDELVRFTENQIDVVSKALLGLTVSCARCHNHKFDAISQEDFYALYGILTSCRPAMITVDAPGKQQDLNRQLAALKADIKRGLANAWRDALPELAASLANPDSDALKKALEEAAKNNRLPLHPLARFRDAEEGRHRDVWNNLGREVAESRQRLEQRRTLGYRHYWKLGGDDYKDWFPHGHGLDHDQAHAAAGAFHIEPDGDHILRHLHPSGVYTHMLSKRHNGVLNSPSFDVGKDRLWIRRMGGNQARMRYAVQNYPRAIGLVFQSTDIKGDTFGWHQWDVKYWEGDLMHMEFTTARDIPIETRNNDRSWFGISEFLVAKPGQPAPREEMADYLAPLFEAESGAPESLEAMAARYRSALNKAIRDWEQDRMTDAQANFVGGFVHRGLLPVTLASLPGLKANVEAYRKLESTIPEPMRAPGILESRGIDQPLFLRGNHKTPGEPVPRRFLEAFNDKPYKTARSGRLELAEDILKSPLASRIIVNRLWHHLFGRGIVPSTDNFGRLGEKPSHPELLDYLATKLRRDGWSLKRMIRFMVMSETFRAKSRPSQRALQVDPANRLLSHYPIRRLEAEAIRDAMLRASGSLDPQMYGPGVDGNAHRRSVYVRVIRNRLDPFLSTFDAPEPLTSRGRRNITNVPGQSLALLNNGFVIDLAAQWAGRSAALAGQPEKRIEQMYLTAFGRKPAPEETARALTYVGNIGHAVDAMRREIREARAKLEVQETHLKALVDPVRDRLLAARKSGKLESPTLPAPFGHWTFDDDFKDQAGHLNAKPHNGARIDGGAAVIAGNAYVATDPLPADITEKTLEARVQLDNLDQRAGGVITIQTLDGVVFDSIVYAEKDSGKWLAGSDTHKRTTPFQGPRETDAHQGEVHLAITYQADGTITGYRNGKPYGKPYRTAKPIRYEAGKAKVVFGCRHLPAGGNRMLSGRILEARLYDRALSPEEVAACAGVDNNYLPEAQLLAAMTPAQKARKEELERDIATLRSTVRKLETESIREYDPAQSWKDLAQSLFNMKEFIYIR